MPRKRPPAKIAVSRTAQLIAAASLLRAARPGLRRPFLADFFAADRAFSPLWRFSVPRRSAVHTASPPSSRRRVAKGWISCPDTRATWRAEPPECGAIPSSGGFISRFLQKLQRRHQQRNGNPSTAFTRRIWPNLLALARFWQFHVSRKSHLWTEASARWIGSSDPTGDSSNAPCRSGLAADVRWVVRGSPPELLGLDRRWILAIFPRSVPLLAGRRISQSLNPSRPMQRMFPSALAAALLTQVVLVAAAPPARRPSPRSQRRRRGRPIRPARRPRPGLRR